MDDEVLGCGGYIARQQQRGDSVSVIICANRAYNHRHDPKLIEREKQCAFKAREILGYDQLRFLDLPDEQLDHKLIDIVVPLERELADLNPEIVLTCHAFDTNQDHKAVFEATMIACRPFSDLGIVKLYSYETPSATDQTPPVPGRQFLPQVYVNIEDFIDRKIAAMAAYEAESRDFPHPRSHQGIRILAQKRGIEVGFKLAETFYILRELDA